MTDERELQATTTKQAAEKAALVWSIADTLRGLYKPVEYGRVILPMTIVKRFHDCLLPTHENVLETAKRTAGLDVRDGFLRRASGYDFYNTSSFTWETLLADPAGIEENFTDYLQGFSENVQDILFQSGMKFDNEIRTMADSGVLYQVVKDFGGSKGDFSPSKVTEVEMGGIFENLVSRFSETDEAGEHFTSRDIVYLMTDLVISADPRVFEGDHIRRLVYDGSMGTSQMLSCMRERLLALDSEADVQTFGQELNPFTFAIAKASALIRGEDADNMRRGNTYDNDQFPGYKFDYVIQNPPFGISFAARQAAIKAEHAKGGEGRFPCELPAVGDGQTLFALNGLAKLKDEGIMAIVQDASPLYKGKPGRGEDDYRRYILENDWLDAIIQLSTDSFVNTGIATYIWLFDKDKPESHRGKVLLVDASNAFVKRRKGIGDKKNDITKVCRDLIVKAYGSWADGTYEGTAEDGSAVSVEAKLFDSTEFGFDRITVYTPERDEDGTVVRDRKGKPVAKTDEDGKKVTDTEDVPLGENIDAYMQREVEPYNPGAWFDKKKVQRGYTIPFTRAFYKYKELEPAEEIAKRIVEHEKALEASLEALFGEGR
ncbi:class I SAM-dependent DNA methyltransferase [Olsenella sp. Marseille-P4559]|uniref:type I restriction-modification system subunit M n=1 Tax=Olsenella sp. Marseille-P4559 TaxID=2364795 RepID=UPI00102F7CF1|nr:class I SAM-dependent DNA methyltransferase [Olsenella sp. Marseille-P4559]